MPAEGPAARLLARLEADVARSSRDQDAAVLAFSGGLASLVLAALARKRVELQCVVVGTRNAADVAAALVARDFLDHRVEVLMPTVSEVLDLARTIRSSDPRLAAPDLLSLIPLALVAARSPDRPVFSGFGLCPRSPAVRRHLLATSVRSPGLGRRTPALPRSLLVRVARELALPDGFTGASRRIPLEGSGIGPALREAGHARHASVGRLLVLPG